MVERALLCVFLLLSACGGSSERARAGEPAEPPPLPGETEPEEEAAETSETQANDRARASDPAKTPEPAAVMQRIRTDYLANIKRCHERVLKRDPQAQGKVVIRFTIGRFGRVTRAEVSGFDPTVSNCIQKLAERWRFETPRNADGEPVSADFQLPIQLRASE